MFAKVVAIILAGGIGAGSLLAVRQERYQLASELTRAQLRIQEHDEDLWALRAEVARRVTPANVHKLAASIGPLKPLVPLPRERIVAPIPDAVEAAWNAARDQEAETKPKSERATQEEGTRISGAPSKPSAKPTTKKKSTKPARSKEPVRVAKARAEGPR